MSEGFFIFIFYFNFVVVEKVIHKKLNIMRKVFFGLMLFVFITGQAQFQNPNIKTVLLHPEKMVLGMPVIELNSVQKLLLSFDELNGDGRTYKCTFVHCNSNWMQSDLEYYQYLNGFQNDDISNIDFSRSKYQDYVHYEYSFPNDNIKFLKSGNYFIRIYDENDPDNMLFERGFTIVDTKVSFAAMYKQPDRSDYRQTHQQVEFTMVCAQGFNIINPYQALNVYVQQNGRPDLVTSPKPKYINGNNYEFRNDDENLIFEGGNQFRNFDIKSLDFKSEYLSKIAVINDSVFVDVALDESKTFAVYDETYDIDGKYAIKADGKYNSELEAEYVYVNFTFKSNFPLKDGSLYVHGALTRGLFNDYSRMDYDPLAKVYRKTLIVKQGYYDYEYIFVDNISTKGSVQLTEGNHWETKNRYYIYAFYRFPGNNYDDCIGFVAF